MTFRAGLMAVLALIALACPVQAGQHKAPQLRVDGSGGVDTFGDLLPGSSGTPMTWRQCNQATASCTALPGFVAGVPADGMTYTPSATGAATQGLKAFLDQFVFAYSFGMVCSPGLATPNTTALTAAMAAGVAAGKPVVLPPGTCPINPLIMPDYAVLQGQGQQATTLKLAPTSNTGTTIIRMGNYSVLRQLTLDGNKGALAADGHTLLHTVGNWGIGGYRIQGARVEDVTVTNVLGYGDAFSDSARIIHLRETVTNTQRPSSLTGTSGTGNGAGFWTGSYTQSSFYYDGGSQYLDCEAAFNDLDGLEYGSNNTTIRGGSYHDNGQFTDLTPADQAAGTHTNLLGGALGAAGIYTAVDIAGGTPSAPRNTLIQGVRAYNNSESGLDLTLGSGSVVSGATISSNGTNGVEIHDGGTLTGVTTLTSAHFALTSSVIYDNGNTTNATWIAGNPNLEVRAGIAAYGRVAYATFADNMVFDARSGVKATSAAVSAGGTGYAVGDTITTVAGIFTVKAVSVGAATVVVATTPTNLSSAPASPLAQTATSGAGTGATLSPTYGPAQSQRWGLYGETRLYSPSFDNWTVTGNSLKQNAVGATNFDGLTVTPVPAAFTNIGTATPGTGAFTALKAPYVNVGQDVTGGAGWPSILSPGGGGLYPSASPLISVAPAGGVGAAHWVFSRLSDAIQAPFPASNCLMWDDTNVSHWSTWCGYEEADLTSPDVGYHINHENSVYSEWPLVLKNPFNTNPLGGTTTQRNDAGKGNKASFTGSITGNVLTVTAIGSGAISSGSQINGAGISANTLVLGAIGSYHAGTGTYTLSKTFGSSITSEAMTIAPKDISTSIEILNNGAKHGTGILIGADALTTRAWGRGEATAVGPLQDHNFYSPNNPTNPAFSIFYDGDGSRVLDTMEVNQNGIHISLPFQTPLVVITPITTAALTSTYPCSAGLKGAHAAVTDATSPTYNGALTGGGTVSVPVYCNGTAWTTH